MCCGSATLGYSGITLVTQGSLWPVCCGRATLGYSGITLASVLWKSSFQLLKNHFGQCAVEELLWASQGSLWPVYCGRATLRYLGITLAVCCGRATLGLVRDHFGQCAVEELSWANGRTEVQSSKNLTTPQSYGWKKKQPGEKKTTTNKKLLLLLPTFGYLVSQAEKLEAVSPL